MPLVDTSLILDSLPQIAQEFGVDPNVAIAMFKAENSGKDGMLPQKIDTMTTSQKGALGIMQVMPDTLKGLVKNGLLPANFSMGDLPGQLRAGVAAIKDAMNRGIVAPEELAIDYNAGASALDTYRKTGKLPAETTGYLPKFSQALGLGGSSQTVRTSKTVIPADKLSDLDEASAHYTAIAQNASDSLKDLAEQMLGSANSAKLSMEKEGQAKADLATAKGDIDVGTIKSRGNLLDAFGINLEGNNQILKQNLDQVIALKQARSEIGDRIASLKSVNPLEDPGGWLLGNFKAMGEAQVYNALVQKENSAMENIREMQALATSQASLQPANVIEARTAQAHAEAQVALAEAKIKADTLDVNINQTLSRNLVELAGLAQAGVAQRIAIAKLYSEKQALSYTQSEREKMLKEQDDTIRLINMQFGQYGFRINKDGFNKLPKDTQDRLVRISSSGSARDMAEGISTIYELIGDAGIARLSSNEDSAQMGKFFHTVVSNGKQMLDALVAKEQKTGIADPRLKAAKTDADKMQLGIQLWQQQMTDELGKSDYSKLSPDNPARLDYGAGATLKQLANNSTSQFVRDALAKGISIDDKLVLSNAVALAQKDPSKLPQLAKDLHMFYETSLADKSLRSGMVGLGWRQPDKYPLDINVTSSWSSLFNSRGKVNMLSRASIEQWMTRQVTSGVVQEGTPAMPATQIFNGEWGRGSIINQLTGGEQ